MQFIKQLFTFPLSRNWVVIHKYWATQSNNKKIATTETRKNGIQNCPSSVHVIKEKHVSNNFHEKAEKNACFMCTLNTRSKGRRKKNTLYILYNIVYDKTKQHNSRMGTMVFPLPACIVYRTTTKCANQTVYPFGNVKKITVTEKKAQNNGGKTEQLSNEKSIKLLSQKL